MPRELWRNATHSIFSPFIRKGGVESGQEDNRFFSGIKERQEHKLPRSGKRLKGHISSEREARAHLGCSYQILPHMSRSFYLVKVDILTLFVMERQGRAGPNNPSKKETIFPMQGLGIARWPCCGPALPGCYRRTYRAPPQENTESNL